MPYRLTPGGPLCQDVSAEGVRVTITTSDGADGAVVVFVDTEFEPDASDGGPGLRVILNDSDVYVGKPYEAKPLTTTERVEAAMRANGLTWESPVVDLIDALIYDGGFTADEADTIVMRGVAR